MHLVLQIKDWAIILILNSVPLNQSHEIVRIIDINEVKKNINKN